MFVSKRSMEEGERAVQSSLLLENVLPSLATTCGQWGKELLGMWKNTKDKAAMKL